MIAGCRSYARVIVMEVQVRVGRNERLDIPRGLAIEMSIQSQIAEELYADTNVNG